MKTIIITILLTAIFQLNKTQVAFCQNILKNENNNSINEFWQTTATNNISKDEYKITFDDNINSYQSPNRNNNTRFIYHNDGFTAKVRQTKIPLFDERNPEIKESDKKYKYFEDWQIKFQVAGFTKSEINNNNNSEYFSEKKLNINSNKAYIESDEMRIDYENTNEGMRQDFIIKQKPIGNDILKLAINVEANLKMNVSKENIIFSNKKGKEMMKYASLKVYDANGKTLYAFFRKSNINKNQFIICVNDNDAQYPITIDPLSSSPVWTSESDQSGANFGYCVASAGDVNGDGKSDVIIGAPYYDNGQNDEGRAYVYYGSSAGLSGAANWTAESNQSGANFGISLSSAGDVNNDGYSDVIIGANLYDNGQTDEGRVFAYFGSPTGLSGADNWTAESNQSGANFGISLSSAGDVNNDGYSDVIIGANLFDNGQNNEGRAFVYYGSITGLSATANWTAESNQTNANFGISVSTADDVNHDGHSDVIIGANLYDNGQNDEGRAYVYYGSSSGLSGAVNWTAESNQSGANFGISVSSVDDVNGDEISEVIIGAYLYDNGQSNEGRAFVYYGSVAGLSSTANWTSESNQTNANFGFCVASVVNVNGDNKSSVLIGAPNYDNGQNDEGRVYVFYDSLSGLATAPGWTSESNQNSAQFGYNVSSAGDVNGDGFSEIIIGSPFYSNGQSSEGRTYLHTANVIYTNDIKPIAIIEPIYIDYPSSQPITPKASFTNIGIANQTNIPVTFIINPGGYSSTKTIPAMSSGTSVQVTFDNFNPTIGISYNITVYSKLASDQNRNNDTIRNSFFMNIPTSQYGCDNGNFEDGGFKYWRGAKGTNTGGVSAVGSAIFTPSPIPYGTYAGPPTNSINLIDRSTNPFDPVITTIPTTHLLSDHSARIGNKFQSNGMDLLAKSFIVDASTSNFTFWYALVLQDPYENHTDLNTYPFFIVRVRNSAGDIVSNLDLEIVADKNNPFFESTISGGETIVFKNWDCGNLDLSSLAGQRVTVEFITGDCNYGGHWGYAYIDDICLGCDDSPTGDCSLNALSSSCDNFPMQVCGNFILPQPTPPSTATCASIDLKIYQNGVQVGTTKTITNPASNNFCFTLNASDFPTVPPYGYDFVASANFVITNGSGGTTYITKSSGIPGTGIIPGTNNDYSVICPDPNGGCGKGSSFPGPDTCYYCFANSIAPSPLYPSRPSYSWESDPSCKMKLIENGVNQAGTKLVKAPDDPTGLDDGYFKVSLKELQLLCNTDTTKKINFCGVCYDSLFVGTNGVIGFTQNSDNPNLRWWEFPTSWNSHNFENGNYLRPGIHPFWNDLYFNHPDSSGGTNGIYCSIKNNQLLITYSRASVFNKSEYVSFQVCYELTNCTSGNGNIKFTYSSAVNGRTSPGFITKYNNSSATSGPPLPNLGPYLVGIAPKYIFGQNYILYRKTDVYGYMGNWETFNEPRINRPLYSATNTGLSVEFGPNSSQLGKCNCSGNGLPTSTSTLEMILAIQGILNPIDTTMRTDTVVVSLRNSTSPYELVESVSAVINSQCNGTASFTNTINGVPYYIQINHRNSIETWSNTPQIFNGDSLTYDFTSAASQAFGNNLTLVGSNWCIYSGDVNQDGTIDAGDVSIVDNASAIGLSGNVPEDLNGDGFVDASDLSIVDENAYNVISAVTP